MKRLQNLDQILEAQVQCLATTSRPRTVNDYRYDARGFLAYLHANFPRVHKASQLHRDPHLLGWFRSLCEQRPPLRNATREKHLTLLRRLLRDVSDNGYSISSDLIRREDFPVRDHYLPRPLPPEEDLRLQQQLRLTDTLEAHALRLIRTTGIRVGECLDLPLDCLQQVSGQQAALRVPLGKLHSERWVPVDDETRRLVVRLVQLRALIPSSCLAKSQGFLLPRCTSRGALYRRLLQVLDAHARRAVCTGKVTPHRLRHSFATEMVRLGVSLPALMQLLGHKNIHMTLRYVEVAQLDVQREFQRAQQNAATRHVMPQLPITLRPVLQQVDIPALRQAIATTRHLFQLLQPQLQDKPRQKLRRLSERLLKIGHELDHLTSRRRHRNDDVYSALAAAILALHLLFILWVVFGATVTRRRPVLRWLHLGSLIWGMLIEILPWNCPLTWAENWLEAGAGVAPYQGGFLLHYLDALVYPNVPSGLLTGFGVAVCVVNLGIYAVRFHRRRLAAW